MNQLVSREEADRIGREVHEDFLAAKADIERIGRELDEHARIKAGICTRLNYHDGPCNGFEREQCELKNKLERQGKIMKLSPMSAQEAEEQEYIASTITRCVMSWYSQVYAWITGKL